jgi:CDP-paratose synthetase
MKILITGVTGALGRKLVPYLLKNKEVSILAIHRNIEKATQLFGNTSSIQFATLEESNEIIAFKPEVIIHLASYVTSSDSFEEGEKLIESNITYGIQLLDILKKANSVTHFLNFGTFAEFKTGSEKTNNTYLYSASKSAFRAFAEYYASIMDFNLIHIVPYSIYGTNDEKKKIFDFILDGFYSENPIKMSPGLQKLDFIHIDDVCRIIYTIITSKKASNYHLQNIYAGTGETHSLRKVASIMEEILTISPKHEWGGLPYRNHEVMYACANINPLIELNCVPKIDLNTGILNYLKGKKLI